MKIQRALLSVSDKAGLLEFAQGLADRGVEIISTGGTAKALQEAGVPLIEISEYTGFPEMMGGRVKTLHPKVHGGLLFKRHDKEHLAQSEEYEIGPIDLVAVNLYPFEATVAKPEVTEAEAIEQIDIGGPSMIRSAAKNHEAVTVVIDPEDYAEVLEEMDEHEGKTSQKLRSRLAVKAFTRTAEYDAGISTFLAGGDEGKKSFSLSLPLDRQLRYGDNPHQATTLYGNFSDYFEQLQGKELSYTNILDIEAAAELISDFRRPTVAILKHTNPCGIGQDDEDLRVAWQKAFETDTQAPFGGVIVTNRPMSEPLARVICEIFTDVIIAPDFTAEARAILQKKKNLRLIRMGDRFLETTQAPVLRSAPGGLMVMERDAKVLGLDDIENKVVTNRVPTAEEIVAMRFGWRVVKHVKSNAIVFAASDRTLGIGAGQMSRVDSSRIAVWKASEAGLSLKGSVVASDALY
ncbi:MAG: bifunctional phosphoribosylaminoimidazolecarboxamide formyltransferase/IMP cyclohydrolase, partial [Verrucomicrobiota bacterium]